MELELVPENTVVSELQMLTFVLDDSAELVLGVLKIQ
jgi:hypothetical protein